MSTSIAWLKALGRRSRLLVALAAAGAAVMVLAACGASACASGSSSGHSPAAHATATTPAAPPATAPVHTANPIPQGNGGDQDADNNGGPSDGDGNISRRPPHAPAAAMVPLEVRGDRPGAAMRDDR